MPEMHLGKCSNVAMSKTTTWAKFQHCQHVKVLSASTHGTNTNEAKKGALALLASLSPICPATNNSIIPVNGL